jgi:nucleotide-binding universal stress UspA family protein
MQLAARRLDLSRELLPKIMEANMSAIERVLFPLDLSLNYGTLTATTRRMFDRWSIEIIMLHAIEEPSRSVRGTDVERSMAQMEFLARKEFNIAQVCRRVERGRAADCILDYARNHAVDVIVMPAGGSESLRRSSLGHVSEEVLTEAPCAVWMEWMTGSVKCIRHICCAVRLDRSDEAVLCRAAEVAEEFGAELTIIHAVAPEPPTAMRRDANFHEQEIRIARMRVDKLREKFAPAARQHIEAGCLDTVVSRTLFRLDAGLLVAAGQGEAIVAAAMACPVLRLATPLPELARASQPHYAGAFQATRAA